MYLPARFEMKNEAEILELIRENPLATLISVAGDHPFVSHIPLIAQKSAAGIILYGHLARANPHWRLLADQNTYAVFHGPQSYITPNWYAEYDVPTWNYTVVHMSGRSTLIEDAPGIRHCLERLTRLVEGESEQAWKFGIPDDLAVPGVLEKAIVGFQIHVEKIQAKFKLSQNRSATDRAGVVEGLRARGDDMGQAIRELMEK